MNCDKPAGARLRTVVPAILAAGVLSSAAEEPAAAKPKRIVVGVLGSGYAAVAPDVSYEEAVTAVIAHWRRELEPLWPDRPDLVVLPEMCDFLPALPPERAKDYYAFRGDRILDFFRAVARERQSYLTYPAIRRLPDGTWRNSVQLIDRTGEVAGCYDKNYPLAAEIAWGVLPGRESPVIRTDFGRVMMAICFDLNFAELRQRCAEAQPDLILFPSMFHGGLLQSIWADECGSYFVGAIAGMEGGIVDPLGLPVGRSSNHTAHFTAAINPDCRVVHLDHHQEKLKKLKEKYGRDVTIFDPGRFGAVLVSSERADLGVDAMLRESAIEPRDDYLRRSAEIRRHALPPP